MDKERESEEVILSNKGLSALDALLNMTKDVDEDVEEFDEDHATDMVMNSMVEDMTMKK